MIVIKRLEDTSIMTIVWEKLGLVYHVHLLLLMKLSTNAQTQIDCLFLLKEGQVNPQTIRSQFNHDSDHNDLYEF